MAIAAHFGQGFSASRAARAGLGPALHLLQWARRLPVSPEALRRRDADRQIARVLARGGRFTDAQEREILASRLAYEWGEPQRPSSMQSWWPQ